jgi:hypothetical protein
MRSPHWSATPARPAARGACFPHLDRRGRHRSDGADRPPRRGRGRAPRAHRPGLWGAHHDLTGPVPLSWPEALELLSVELGEPVTFRVAAEREYLDRLTGAGIPAGTVELLITREWAILAGENDYTTGTFQQITGRPPRPVAEFLHQYRAEFT